jgi:hypothetical protein
MASKALLQAIAVCAELTRTQLSEAAVRVLVDDLSRYPEAQVLHALSRCRRELRSGLTLADILARLDDGRPGPEEAWAMIPRDEATSVVWTEEMSQAWGVAQPLLAEGDQVAARMAFLEHYRGIVQAARDRGQPPRWTPSLGHDPAGREEVLVRAVELGRLSAAHVAGLLPHRDAPHPRLQALLASSKLLTSEAA